MIGVSLRHVKRTESRPGVADSLKVIEAPPGSPPVQLAGGIRQPTPATQVVHTPQTSPAVHTPALQVSFSVQRSPSEQGTPSFPGRQPTPGLQVVQVPQEAPGTQTLMKQVSPVEHGSPSSQGIPLHSLPAQTEPERQVPFTQVSGPLQPMPSSHGVPFCAVCTQWPPPSHAPVVHGFPSSGHALVTGSYWQVGEQQRPATVF